MARIPDDELERLKREVDLAELARSRGVALERRGRDLVGLCPLLRIRDKRIYSDSRITPTRWRRSRRQEVQAAIGAA
jgi:hypothetical protein